MTTLFARLATVCIAACTFAAVAATPAHALATYTYTAPVFNNWYDGNGRGFALYAGLDGSGIQLQFTTAAPLVNVGNAFDTADVTSQVLTWSYHGGSPILNQSSATTGALSVQLTTNPDGSVFYSKFYVNGPVVIPTLEAYSSSMTVGHDANYDQQTLNSNYHRVYGRDLRGNELLAPLGEYMSTPVGEGSWSMTVTSPVPEPGSLGLAGTGLVAMAAWLRRRSLGWGG
jgi:PEP-CTERM motif